MKTNWHIISASVAGKGHLISGVPCQDANHWEILNKYWGIAVTADGAGSYANSQIGSQFVSKNVIEVLKSELSDEKWFKHHKLPDNNEWREIALKSIKQTLSNLKQYCLESAIDVQTTGCTLNVAVFSVDGILAVHIGDGRACFLNDSDEWNSMIKPFKGEEVGSTVFITTEWIWECPEICIETNVVRSKIKSFVLMTDGMESYSYFNYRKYDNGNYYDPNIPFENFLNSNLKAIEQMVDKGMNEDEINQLWYEYLGTGKNLSEEYDDKTMLIGIFKSK